MLVSWHGWRKKCFRCGSILLRALFFRIERGCLNRQSSTVAIGRQHLLRSFRNLLWRCPGACRSGSRTPCKTSESPPCSVENQRSCFQGHQKAFYCLGHLRTKCWQWAFCLSWKPAEKTWPSLLSFSWWLMTVSLLSASHLVQFCSFSESRQPKLWTLRQIRLFCRWNIV